VIIESAFYRLPELWINGSEAPSGERDISHNFGQVISDLLGGNSNAPPSVDEAYPINRTGGAGPKLTADLCIKTQYGFHSVWRPLYFIQEETWIETKYYRGGGKTPGFILNSKETREIKRDLLKLCLLVKQEPGIKYKSRYFCAFFYGMPDNRNVYSPLRSKKEHPQWLINLLSPGLRNSTQISFENDAVLPAPLELTLNSTTYAIAPIPTLQHSVYLYWGYLVRIFGFTVHFDTSDTSLRRLRLSYEEPDGEWLEKDAQVQQEIGEMLIKAIGRRSG
jgi:hypothetical protein